MSDEARLLELTSGLRTALLRLAEGPDAVDAVDAVGRELAQGHPRLSVEVLSLKRVPAGAGVSYGHTHVTAGSTVLALAAMGYGDGMPRKAGNRARVTVGSGDGAHPVPIVGRVAMNAFVIDVGDQGIDPGDRVTVFGDPARGEIPLAEWAASVGETPVSVLKSIAAHARVSAGS